MNSLSQTEAYAILRLPIGADRDAVQSSYKRLALQWLPEKHQHSSESISTFSDISRAYTRLISDNEYVLLDLKEMYKIFNKVIHPKSLRNKNSAVSNFTVNNWSGSDDEQTFEADSKTKNNRSKNSSNFTNSNFNSNLTAKKMNSSNTEIKQSFKKNSSESNNTSNKAEPYSNSKNENNTPHFKNQLKNINSQVLETHGEADENSSVYTTVSKKSKKPICSSNNASSPQEDTPEQLIQHQLQQNIINNNHNTINNNNNNNNIINDSNIMATQNNNNNINNQQHMHNGEQVVYGTENVLIISRRFAIEGNKLANSGLYNEAIEQFTKAIQLDPTDFRFFGNRSFCFERQEEYTKALADADRAIALSADWPKGYFRKGKALAGKKMYVDAEEAYLHVLKLDSKCPDAKLELIGVKVQQLVEMGFKKEESLAAIQQYESVQAALEALLSNQVSEMNTSTDGKYSQRGNSSENVLEMSGGVGGGGKKNQNATGGKNSQTQKNNSVASTSAGSGNSNNKQQNKSNNLFSNNTAAVNLTGGGGSTMLMEGVNGGTTNNGMVEGEKIILNGKIHNVTSLLNNKTEIKNKSSSNQQRGLKAPIPPIPQHHYDQAQRQILSNKQQQDVVKMKSPRNPEGLTSLWVGNVLPEVKPENLTKMFSKYGQLQSVKSIPEKFCAFINFNNKECAGKAMECLQGTEVMGHKLLIKFPDHPVTSKDGEKVSSKVQSAKTGGAASGGTGTVNNSINKTSASQLSNAIYQNGLSNSNQMNGFVNNNNIYTTLNNSSAANGVKDQMGPNRTTGPVNGDECYFWRTTGCQFTGTCRYKHVNEHKGVDRKPWHKSK